MQISTLLITLALISISVNVFSQTDSIKTRIDPKTITTQGQQEHYWEQEIFDKKYAAQHFDKYKGTITIINKNAFRYNGNIITAGFATVDYRLLFEKGIFHPAIFLGHNDGGLLEVQKGTDQLPGNDSLGISNIEELKFLNPSVKIKRVSSAFMEDRFIKSLLVCF